MGAAPCSTEMYSLISSADMDSTDYAGPTNEAAMAAWMNIHHHHQHDHDPSLRSGFPCHGNQGLSLSLRSSDQPSIAGLPAAFDQLGYLGQSWIRASKYLGPAQDLLVEFCAIGKKESEDNSTSKLKLPNTSHRPDDEIDATLAKPSLDSLDLLELQMRKTKLIQMIHQLDMRYKQYRNQMRVVVSSLEDVAGDGAATVYSTMASKVMSKHFRCLKDGIAAQIKATKKAIEEKNVNAATEQGANTGETPRLRLLDQALRQQRAHQQMNIMGSHPWRSQRGLPERSVTLLRAWLFEHFFHPYPSDVDKHVLAHQTGLSRSQVSNWFINARVRLWKPMVEEMYSAELEEGLDENKQQQSHLSRPNYCDRKAPGLDRTAISRTNRDAGMEGRRCLQNPKFVEIDFSAYGDRRSSVDGGGVSLTLGLHQHGGVRVAFPPAAAYQMEECETAPYSVLDECEGGQNLAYRDLMEAQLLHDLAG